MLNGRTPIRGLLSRALSYGGTDGLSCIGREAVSLSHKNHLIIAYAYLTSWESSPVDLSLPHDREVQQRRFKSRPVSDG
jgi:hypothetical protein